MRRLLLENFSLKLIAFIISLALVLFVRGDIGAVESFDVTVIVREPRGHVLLSAREVPVRAQVRGKWSKLQELSHELGPVSVSPPANDGTSQLFLSPDLLQLPPGLVVESFSPAALKVELEEELLRTVPIAVEQSFVGNVPDGYRLGTITAVPQTVDIIGPRTLVEDIEHVLFEPINLSKRTSTFVEQKEILPGRFGVQVNGVSRVNLRVEIVSDAQTRVASGVPVIVLGLSRPYEILPEHLDLVLVGTQEALADVDPEALYVTLDGSAEETKPPRSIQKRLSRDDIHNLPDGVGVDDTRLQSVILRTFAEEPEEGGEAAPPPEEAPPAPPEPGSPEPAPPSP